MSYPPRPLTSEYSVLLGFSFNINLGHNLTYFRNAVLNQDWDCAVLIDGSEGAGKSVLAGQVATFLDVDRKIDIDTQICFTPTQFKTAVLSLKKGKAIVWDEARRGVNRRRSVKEVNLEMTDLLAECRQHNLFLIIVMPSFYDMDMNVAVWRSRALIHVWYDWDKNNKERPLNRGYFRFYNESGKKNLYCNRVLRQRYAYPVMPNDSFEGTFPNHYVVDETDYRKRKRMAESKYEEGKAEVLSCPTCACKDVRTAKLTGQHSCRQCGLIWGRKEARNIVYKKAKRTHQNTI